MLTYFFCAYSQEIDLPKVDILGQEYFVYEVKKNESIYGIAKRYHWNLDELLRLNPNATSKISKGTKIYYPTGTDAIASPTVSQAVEVDYSSLPPIRHIVKKGENVYSISRQYGAPLEFIYKNNPWAKQGVKPGEIVEIPQTGNLPYYFYTIQPGDNLLSISQTFNTSIEDILKNNSALTSRDLKSGEIIRININSNLDAPTTFVSQDQVTQLSSYRVGKNESWDDIAEKTGVEAEILRQANDAQDSPKENAIITVPVVETVTVETHVSPENEGGDSQSVQEIYDSVKGNNLQNDENNPIKIALLLDEPTSKKDIDFTRGMLVSLAELKETPYKVDLKVIDGGTSSNQITETLEDYEPSIIISTADKNFPMFLADFGNTHNVQVINIFDLRTDLYEDNPSIIQILQPSAFFNSKIASKIHKDNVRRQLIFVGDEDENDGIASELSDLFKDNVQTISLEEFGNYEADPFTPILVYSYANRKEDISDFLNNVEHLIEANPEIDLRIIGRSSWIASINDFGDQFEEYRVWIPSRVWIEEEEEPWKNFLTEYEKLFYGMPVRSIPNFAASGYDIANYFIPLLAQNKGDFNKGAGDFKEGMLQNDIKLNRVSNWGGFLNGIAYLIRFSPESKGEKIIVK